MQLETDLLKSQQAVLSLLGFYKGPIDGLWGPDSIQAKKQFEQSKDFEPAIPSNGLPFSDRGPFPGECFMTRKGLSLQGKEKEVEDLLKPVKIDNKPKREEKADQETTKQK